MNDNKIKNLKFYSGTSSNGTKYQDIMDGDVIIDRLYYPIPDWDCEARTRHESYFGKKGV